MNKFKCKVNFKYDKGHIMKIRENPDKEYSVRIKRALKENNGYCPCSVIKSPETKCMCEEFRAMKSGMCHCGLFIKEE